MRSSRAVPPSGPLHLVHVVDVARARDLARIRTLLRNGVTALWLRDPAATARSLFDAAVLLQQTTTVEGGELWIGDRVDVARAVGAHGVQLGHRAIPARHVRPWFGGRMGVSCHDAVAIADAVAAGADHVVVSPIFDVPGKGPALGVERLRGLAGAAGVPVVALGGIDRATVVAVRAAGVAGVAVTRALADAAEPGLAARALAGMTRA